MFKEKRQRFLTCVSRPEEALLLGGVCFRGRSAEEATGCEGPEHKGDGSG